MTGLEKLAQAVAALTQRPWYIDLTTSSVDFIGSKSGVKIYSHHYSGKHDHPDAPTIVALRNCADELIAVAKAAREIPRQPSLAHRLLTPGWGELNAALAALEKKLGEGT